MDESNADVLTLTSTRAGGPLTWAKALFKFAQAPQRNFLEQL